MNFNYDVALSFAGEDRNVIEPIADALHAMGIRVFYDKYEEAYLWGKDLYQHLDEVYRTRARFCVIFASDAYAQKAWTKLELRSAQARALQNNSEYILPARLDDTAIPGITPTTAYINIRDRSAQEVAALIAAKVTAADSPGVETLTDAAWPISTDQSRASIRGEFLELRSELDTLRKAMAPRELTFSARQVLTEHLQRLAAERVGVRAPETDEEAQEFAAVIGNAFLEGGWNVDSGVSIYPSSIVGVRVVALTGASYPWRPIPDIAHQIAAALTASGIDAAVQELREMPQRFRIFIAVGKKPRGA